MAYKIQVGDATLGGTLTQEGELTAQDSHISASAISASQDVIIHGGGTADAAAGFFVDNAGTVAAENKINFSGSTASWFEMEVASNDGKISLSTNASPSRNSAIFGADGSDNGSLTLAATTADTTFVSLIDGELSASSNLQIGGTMTVGTNLVVNGNLTVQGTRTDDNATTFQVADKIVLLARGTDINGNNGGLAFGLTGSNNTGSVFTLDTGGGGRAFQALDGDASGLINISASAFVGSGVQLSSVTTSGIKLTPQTKTDGNTLSEGLNLVALGGSNVALTLPSGSESAPGVEYIVKLTTAVGSNYVTISRDGTDNIDGENSIRLESDRAAVRLVYNNSGSFKVY